MLAFLAAGMSVTSLAVGTALAGSVANLGLALAVCLLNPPAPAFGGPTGILPQMPVAAGCLRRRDGLCAGRHLSYTGTGLLMFLFVVFVMTSIVYQHHYSYAEGSEIVTTAAAPRRPAGCRPRRLRIHRPHDGFSRNEHRQRAEKPDRVIAGLALLAFGAQALVYSAATLANVTGTIQALWAATLISFGFCLPLLADALDHPFGSVWKRFATRCRYFPPQTLPMQLLNSAILNLTLAAADLQPDVPPPPALRLPVPAL